MKSVQIKSRVSGFDTAPRTGCHDKTVRKIPATSIYLTTGNLQNERMTGRRQNGNRIVGKANPSLKILRKGSQPLGLGDELLVVTCRLFGIFSDRLPVLTLD